MLLASGALVLAGAAPSPAPDRSAKTVDELSGLSPGKNQRCVSVQPGNFFTTSQSDPHILLYDDGKTVWASRLDQHCGFEPGQTVIPDTSASYYCHGDFVRAGSRVTLLPFGPTCVLGNFTPYRATK